MKESNNRFRVQGSEFRSGFLVSSRFSFLVLVFLIGRVSHVSWTRNQKRERSKKP